MFIYVCVCLFIYLYVCVCVRMCVLIVGKQRKGSPIMTKVDAVNINPVIIYPELYKV